MKLDLRTGCADSALTPTRAAAAGLLVGGAVLIGLWSYAALTHWLAARPAAPAVCASSPLQNCSP
jgi:hypothetical protein